jgi:hypothetical protein
LALDRYAESRYSFPRDDSLITREDFALIAVRLVALIEVSQGIHTASMSVQYWLDDVNLDRWRAVWITVASLSPLVLGTVMFFASRKIAAWMLPRQAQTEEVPPGNSEIHSVVTGLIGIYCLGFAVPNLWSRWMIFGTPSFGGESVWHESMPFMRDLVAVGFGVALFVGARFWTRLFFKLRDLGHDPDKRDST